MSSRNADTQHYAWLAKSFGRTDYLLMTLDDLEAVASVGEYVTKYPGTHLFKQGAASTAAFVVQQGSVELYRGASKDRRVVTRVGPGAVIGDIAMFKGDPYHSSARAVDSVTAMQLNRDTLIPLLLQRPVIAMRWLVAGLDQLDQTQRRVLRLMHRTVIEQVADLILDEADDRGEVHLSQSAIATLLSASRQSVNEALSELRTRGGVETGYRNVRILDETVLEALTNS
jgi:CRP-like cAMP-binding protein